MSFHEGLRFITMWSKEAYCQPKHLNHIPCLPLHTTGAYCTNSKNIRIF